ncbi:hypothetical protein MMC07_000798 [Pseudocyphellaria aurata]|nr:hypothetical protein [Pseudocyphellaria aurata]
MTNIRASSLRPSTLQRRPLSTLCTDYVGGFCRHGDNCKKSHDICTILEEDSRPDAPAIDSQPNWLSLDPRLPFSDGRSFDDDGPGNRSKAGARHQNDHVDIHHISILPTTDEILCRRPPFVPRKGPQHKHHLADSQARHLDINFRQLRYDHTESIIDICYHATQRLVTSTSQPQLSDYEVRSETPQGRRYSLFQDVEIVELDFEERNGIVVRLSFSCPPALRGRRLPLSGHFQKGMLAALIGFNEAGLCVSTTFLEVVLCQSTTAMKVRTGNELRASILLSFADRQDIEAVRRLLYIMQGHLLERFVLVEFPGALLAGYSFCLKKLQELSGNKTEIAFSSLIAPSDSSSSPIPAQPRYTTAKNFTYNCDVLRSAEYHEKYSQMTLNPELMRTNETYHKEFLRLLAEQTTLDNGQAVALCENLCRGLAFTQGPPGTGKTFLGVALAKVILASRTSERKPILAVCMTNHALDSFLGDLHGAGVTKLARLGRGSKEDWVKQFQISELAQRMKSTQIERMEIKNARLQLEGLTKEGVGWCEALNQEYTSWPAIRGHLKVNFPAAFESFVGLESVSEARLSDIRLARKAGGFAFEYWCQGGDIKDVNQLLERFETMLGDNDSLGRREDADLHSRERVLATITRNAELIGSSGYWNDVWTLRLQERKELLKQWKEQVNPWTIVDQAAEIHRRHQSAVSKMKNVHQSVNARCLAQQDVIGLTTTACAMNWLLIERLGLETVICEEAGEVMEAQTLCTLFPTIGHAIFIGDPQQLRPQVNEQSLSLETTRGKGYRLDESLFERMMFPSTPGLLPLATSRLNLQRRMQPEIANLMRATLYPFLQDHESTHNHPPVAGMVESLWWFDHQKPEDRSNPCSPMSKSYSNSFEVDMTIGLVHYLVNTNEYDFNDIAILTPYNGQLAALTQRLRGTCSVWLSEKDRTNLIDTGLLTREEDKFGKKADVGMSSMLRLATIDNFQGEEAKVVILSTVRSNPEDRVGFLKTSNRINVACSRARDGFYIIGNASHMRGVEMWSNIVSLLTKTSKIGGVFQTRCSRHPANIYNVEQPEDFDRIPACQAVAIIKKESAHPKTNQSFVKRGVTKSLSVVMFVQGDVWIAKQSGIIRLVKKSVERSKVAAILVVQNVTVAAALLANALARNLASMVAAQGHVIQSAIHVSRRAAGNVNIWRHAPQCAAFRAVESRAASHVLKYCSVATNVRACVENVVLLGSVPAKPQLFLACGHHFDLETFDAHVGLKNVYDIDSTGVIKRALVNPSAMQAFGADVCCPECGAACVNIRRYAIFKQLRDLPDTVDRLYAKMGRKMNMFMDLIVRSKDDLDTSFEAFSKSMRPGPLTGKTNERWVRDRGNAMMEVQQKIVNFRDDVVAKFENDLVLLADFFGNSEILASLNSPFKLRHDSLFYRCRLITLEESARMCELLEKLGHTSRHMTTLFRGLRDMTIAQALQNITNIRSSIVECEVQDLKRLEVELRLIQVSFHTVLEKLGQASDMDVDSSMEKVRKTCTQYPDTAGIFLPIHKPSKSFSGLFCKGEREFWRLWGRHEIGNIKYCTFGHPFSSKTFSGCPECGRKVEKRPQEVPIDYNKFLYENAFIEQMLRMKIKA